MGRDYKKERSERIIKARLMSVRAVRLAKKWRTRDPKFVAIMLPLEAIVSGYGVGPASLISLCWNTVMGVMIDNPCPPEESSDGVGLLVRVSRKTGNIIAKVTVEKDVPFGAQMFDSVKEAQQWADQSTAEKQDVFSDGVYIRRW